MFNLISIELFNFRSYVGKHKFAFPTVPGLYSLTGDNRVNPRLGANGSGKSTLLDAIYWCFFGRTTRGLKAGDIISWDHKTCSVTLKLTVGDSTAIITRKQAPNALELDGKPVDQDTIQKFIRLAPDAFTHSVMLDQFGEAFFDLAPGPKLALFSQIMELDYWLERSKAAAELANELAEEKVKQEHKLADCTGQIKVIEEDILNLRQLAARYADEQALTVTKLKADLATAKKEQAGLKGSLETARQALAGAEARLKLAESALGKHEQRLSALQKQLQGLLSAHGVAKGALTAVRASLKGLTGLGATCPTCLQKVTSGHLKAESAKLTQRQTEAANKVEDLDDQISEINEEINVLQNSGKSALEAANTIDRNRRDFEREVSACAMRLELMGAKMDVFRNSIAEAQQQANPYQTQINDKRDNLNKRSIQSAALKAQIEETSQDHAAVSYWINGFKRIRLFIIDEALQQLEIEVNNNLASLGLLDWQIKFDAERENKSGGITKGFTVLVYTPGHKEPVKFESWSGGETQRLRLAGDLGLANLITQHAGLTSTIEFFDEPSSHLSEEGLLDLAETLHQRAVTSHKRIFLVDHRSLDFGDYAGRIIAVKDANGSRLVGP